MLLSSAVLCCPLLCCPLLCYALLCHAMPCYARYVTVVRKASTAVKSEATARCVALQKAGLGKARRTA